MQISFCSLWNLNRAKGRAWVRDVLYRPVHHSNSTGRNYPAQAETPSVCYFLLRFLTLMTGVQIECSFCQIPGHTVRSDGEWVAYSPDTGQESREQPGCRDLPSVCTTPQPSCPSDLPHHNWLSKGSAFFPHSILFYQLNQCFDWGSESCWDSNDLSFTYTYKHTFKKQFIVHLCIS